MKKTKLTVSLRISHYVFYIKRKMIALLGIKSARVERIEIKQTREAAFAVLTM